ncbi:MAG: hypothetical protein PHO83_13675 [Geobacteraceae bacterium]|nr:hypothetical protein [Geobacteraceae bacterium]
MSVAIIDAREWQKTFDLRTGETVADRHPLFGMVQGVQERHPYPGDLDVAGNRWVTDTALDLMEQYDPSFVFLTYAQQYFSGRYSVLTDADWPATVAAVFEEVERFVARSGFTPLIVGTGGMTPLAASIDLTRLDGLALCTHWSARYAGLHDPSPRDLQTVAAHPEIERIVTRDDFRQLFRDSPSDGSRAPEYLLVAREGCMFKTAGGAFRQVRRVPSPGYFIPVSACLEDVSDVTDIRKAVDRRISTGRVALIFVEGLGADDFPWPSRKVANGREWFFYETGDAQYLTITTGRHQVFEYPPGYRYFEEDGPGKEFPFSGYFRSVPEDTIGATSAARSIAVGNRSMFMHMAAGADISLECFARNLYNQGTMAVIHRSDKA